MHFTSSEITAWLGSFLWPFFRVGALMMAAPILGAQTVPVRVRLSLALAVTLVIAPLVKVPTLDPFSLPALVIIFQQLMIGIAIGFALQLVFSAIVVGGQLIAMQAGLGFASMVDPQNGVQIPVVSQLYLLVTTLIFLGMDGHLMLIHLLADSFRVMPVGADGIDREGMWALATWGSQMLAGGVWLALPALASLLVVNIAFGVMARAAPQLNIFSIGFPITLLMGFIVMLYTLPEVVPQFQRLLEDGFELISRVLGGT